MYKYMSIPVDSETPPREPLRNGRFWVTPGLMNSCHSSSRQGIVESKG